MAKASEGLLIGYARVSTDDQELRLQIDALEKAGCHNIYREHVSGASKRRPQLDLAIMDLRPGDTLVVWRIDRLARSMRELYTRLDAIHAAGATFRSLQESFEFSTAVGQFILGVLGLVAELERQLTRARTKAGMDALKARGVRFGSPLKMTAARIREARRLLKRPDWSVPRVAQKFGVAEMTIYKHIPGGKMGVVGGKRQYVKFTPRKRKHT